MPIKLFFADTSFLVFFYSHQAVLHGLFVMSFACLFYLVRHLQALSYGSSARGLMSLHHDILNIQINEKLTSGCSII